MDNLNFIPKSLQDRYKELSIKRLKNAILIFWIFCLILFAAFNYLEGRNKKLNKENNYEFEYDLNKPIEVNKNYGTISSFKEFLHMVKNDLHYTSVSINNKEINLNLIVKTKEQYYNIVKDIESSATYKILYLSPLNDKDNVLNFQMIVEVH